MCVNETIRKLFVKLRILKILCVAKYNFNSKDESVSRVSSVTFFQRACAHGQVSIILNSIQVVQLHLRI